MKKLNIYPSFFILLSFLSLVGNAMTNSQEEGHKIEIKINGFKDTTLILGHYFNQRMYVDDTTRIDSNGRAVFTDKEALPGGIYVVYLPNKKYFDLLIDRDQTFKVSVDTSNFITSMEVIGSEQTKAFNRYQRFIFERQEKAQKLQERLKAAGSESNDREKIREELDILNEEVKNHWNELIKKHPGSLLALFLKGIQEVEIPEFDLPEGVKNTDSIRRVKTYQYYRTHYFDNIDLTDERILRTPFFGKKVAHYFSSLVPQIPDTLLKEAITIIEKSRPSPNVFQFLVSDLFNFANDSKIMGMDKMLVGLAEKYYLSGEATWADEEFLKKLETRVKELKPTLIGNQAHDLKMQAYDGPYFRLYEIQAPITILVFWETDCGHCKKEIPKLNKIYQEDLIEKGVKVFAVYTQGDQPEWVEFIEKHELYDFINVWDPYRHTGFRDYYDVKSTPTIFILDKNKKIIGKRIAVDDLPGFIDHFLKFQNEKG
ncbi:redoxin domain-containing protein [Thermophagus sp. OGC60D27]|uniref:redoxin domain-containing protein n=1 Tax=Thermophagus sp. OGC60D27 TaxID=3458415 RepID=UPI0040379581